jgi:hypothetical protein
MKALILHMTSYVPLTLAYFWHELEAPLNHRGAKNQNMFA